MWYDIHLKFPFYLKDKDYQDFVLFNLFRYTDTVDISLMEYCSVSVDIDEKTAAKIIAENDFITQIRSECDRGILARRTFIRKDLT